MWATVWPQQTWAEKWRGCCAPFRRGAGFPPNTMSIGPRPTSVSSGVLIRPTVWPQYINVTDIQDTCPIASGEQLLVTVRPK